MAQRDSNYRDEQEERRKRARRMLAALLRRVEQVCGPIERVDEVADDVNAVVDDIRAFLDDEELGGLVPGKRRAQLRLATERFKELHARIDRAAEVCGELQNALKLADRALASTPTPFPRGTFGIGAVVAVVVGAAFLWQFVIADDTNVRASFEASTNTVTSFQEPACSTLRWEVEGAASVRLDGSPVPSMSTAEVCPSETTTYVIQIEVDDGNVQDFSQTVEVIHDDTPPELELTISPDAPTAGQPLQVSIEAQDSQSGLSHIDLYVANDHVGTCDASPCEFVAGPFGFGTVDLVAFATDAVGNERQRDATVTIEQVPNAAPVVQILRPNDDLERGYDGYDEDRGMWFADVPVVAEAVDREDGELRGESLVWMTDRTDLQEEILGTGRSPVLRLYSESCEGGARHDVAVIATDSAGASETATRSIYIWTIC